MSQQFAVNQGASIVIGTTFYRGPCALPDEAVEHLRSSVAGKGPHSVLEDHIRNGFVIPIGASAHIDRDLIQPGVRSSEQPALRTDNDRDPRKATPDSLTVSTGEGSIDTSTQAASPQSGASSPEQGSGEDIGFPGDRSAPEVTSGLAGKGWTMSDEQVEGLTIDELNTAIIERLPMDERSEFKLFEDEDAARAFLQQDLVT